MPNAVVVDCLIDANLDELVGVRSGGASYFAIGDTKHELLVAASEPMNSLGPVNAPANASNVGKSVNKNW